MLSVHEDIVALFDKKGKYCLRRLPTRGKQAIIALAFLRDDEAKPYCPRQLFVIEYSQEINRKKEELGGIDMLGQALAAENRFTANAQLWARYERREKAMKDAVSFVSAARQEGEAIGDARGSLRTALSSARNLMSKTGWSAEKSMDTLGYEADLQKELLVLLEG